MNGPLELLVANSIQIHILYGTEFRAKLARVRASKLHVNRRREIKFIKVDSLNQPARGVAARDARSETQLRHQRVKLGVHVLRARQRGTIVEQRLGVDVGQCAREIKREL